MNIVAFTSEGIKVTSTNDGVTISKQRDNWGDPWAASESSISIKDVSGLIKALQEVKLQKDYDEW